MADEVNNQDKPREVDNKQETREEATPLVDEYGEPLTEEHEHIRKRPLYRRPGFLIAVAIGLLVILFFGGRYWLYARSHESTDDAFIDGHIIQVSPKVSGYVVKVYVTDNQQVKAGDLLAELDTRDLEAKVDQAKAALNAGLAQQKQAQTQVTLTRVSARANVKQAAGVNTAEANMQQARAQLTAAQAEANRANADVQRYQSLFEKDEVSRQRLDQAIA